MKLPLIAIAFFLALGMNTKSIAQARYASTSAAAPATHSGTASADNYDTHTNGTAVTTVKETAGEVSHAATPSGGAAVAPAINMVTGTAASGITAGGYLMVLLQSSQLQPGITP